MLDPNCRNSKQEHLHMSSYLNEYGYQIFLLVAAVLALSAVAKGIRAVPQGFQWTVERFGRYRTTLYPGLNLVVPFIDTIGRKLNVQETVLEIPSQTVITKDNASVLVDGIVFF